MSLSRKRKKEFRKLQKSAARLWESQQGLVGDAASVARDATRQIGNVGREQVLPAVQENYERYAAPYVTRGAQLGKHLLEEKVVPAVGGVVGSALSVWDAANDRRDRIAVSRGLSSMNERQLRKAAKRRAQARASFLERFEPPQQKKGIGAGGVIAIILGAAAAAGVLYAAWQTLRADDELWVADDPLNAPDN